MDKEYIAVELTDEELAKVVGGKVTPNGDTDDGITNEGMSCNLGCGTCTLASAQYLTCPTREYNSSICKHNR